MKLARAMQLPVPEVHLLHLPEKLYIVQRYDRHVVNGHIVCMHQIDACQLLGVGSDWKYERQGGLVSLKKIAHAKNISVLIDETGFALAPFYDLLCVQAYGDDRLALYIGDDDTHLFTAAEQALVQTITGVIERNCGLALSMIG